MPQPYFEMEESRSVTPWVNRLNLVSGALLDCDWCKTRHKNLVPLLSGVKPDPMVGSGRYAESIPVKSPVAAGCVWRVWHDAVWDVSYLVEYWLKLDAESLRLILEGADSFSIHLHNSNTCVVFSPALHKLPEPFHARSFFDVVFHGCYDGGYSSHMLVLVSSGFPSWCLMVFCQYSGSPLLTTRNSVSFAFTFCRSGLFSWWASSMSSLVM